MRNIRGLVRGNIPVAAKISVPETVRINVDDLNRFVSVDSLYKVLPKYEKYSKQVSDNYGIQHWEMKYSDNNVGPLTYGVSSRGGSSCAVKYIQFDTIEEYDKLNSWIVSACANDYNHFSVYAKEADLSVLQDNLIKLDTIIDNKRTSGIMNVGVEIYSKGTKWKEVIGKKEIDGYMYSPKYYMTITPQNDNVQEMQNILQYFGQHCFLRFLTIVIDGFSIEHLAKIRDILGYGYAIDIHVPYVNDILKTGYEINQLYGEVLKSLNYGQVTFYIGGVSGDNKMFLQLLLKSWNAKFEFLEVPCIDE